MDSILIAQNKFARGLIGIGKLASERQKAMEMAHKTIGELYEYDEASALFKPTKAKLKPFRNTFEGTLSYFSGGHKDFPEDKGFALEPWVDIQFKNHGFVFNEASALAMGHYKFISAKGHTITAEFSFTYRKNSQGLLKIIMHHSSLPFN